jgi:hypothetical protein
MEIKGIPSLSQILDHVWESDGLPGRAPDAIEEGRGLRLNKGRILDLEGNAKIGDRLYTRDKSKGREWNVIGRILDQRGAVKLVEKSLDDRLGAGEGKKLLKAMGGVYRTFGARITAEQVETARIRAEALSGEAIKFGLPPEKETAVRETIVNDFASAKPMQPGGLDPVFEGADANRIEFVFSENGVVSRDVYKEMVDQHFNDVQDAKNFVRQAILELTREEGDDEETNLRRALHFTAIPNQRTIGTSFSKVFEQMGGTPVANSDTSTVLAIIDKTRDKEGRAHFKINLVTVKQQLTHFIVPEEVLPRDLVKEDSFFTLDQKFEIGSADLARGNGKGLTVHPAKAILKMVVDKAPA